MIKLFSKTFLTGLILVLASSTSVFANADNVSKGNNVHVKQNLGAPIDEQVYKDEKGNDIKKKTYKDGTTSIEGKKTFTPDISLSELSPAEDLGVDCFWDLYIGKDYFEGNSLSYYSTARSEAWDNNDYSKRVVLDRIGATTRLIIGHVVIATGQEILDKSAIAQTSAIDRTLKQGDAKANSNHIFEKQGYGTWYPVGEVEY